MSIAFVNKTSILGAKALGISPNFQDLENEYAAEVKFELRLLKAYLLACLDMTMNKLIF